MKFGMTFFAFGLAAFGQQTSSELAVRAFEEIAKLFGADPKQPHNVAMTAIGVRKGVRTFDFSFASPVAGRVPGVLVVPDRPGRFPVILFGHWMMAGSPMRKHTEFLEEAITYSRAGAVCLLLDTPLVREGVVEDPAWTHGQEPNAALQMAREWRRALDILLLRKDVDPKRVAYVGHSFSAGVGAKLMGVEKRIQSFVLMAGTYALRDYIFDEQDAVIVEMRNRMGVAAIENYLRKFPWEEPAVFVGHAAPAAVFVQNGRTDKELPERIVRKSFGYFNGPKQIEFYDAGHELNSAARVDRAKWLQGRLRMKGLDLQTIRLIEQLR